MHSHIINNFHILYAPNELMKGCYVGILQEKCEVNASWALQIDNLLPELAFERPPPFVVAVARPAIVASSIEPFGFALESASTWPVTWPTQTPSVQPRPTCSGA